MKGLAMHAAVSRNVPAEILRFAQDDGGAGGPSGSTCGSGAAGLRSAGSNHNAHPCHPERQRRISPRGLAWTLFLALLAATVPAFAAPAGQTRTIPFGEASVLRAAPLRATALVLSAEETLRSVAQPDSERWQVDWSEYGPDGSTVPVVTVTPTDCGLETNLLIFTTRRIYSLSLASPACNAKGESEYDAIVRFRYPEGELVKDVPVPTPPPVASFASTASIDKLAVNSGRYRIEKRHGYRGAEPKLVTDDGTATYLIFPEGSWKRQDLPLLFLIDAQGERQLTNYDVEGTTFVIRQLFREALLVAGDAKKKSPALRIVRQ